MTTQRPSAVAEAKTLLVRHAELLATMDDGDGRPGRRRLVVGNVIRQVGPTAELPATADEVIDARGMVVLPGLINTHHHFYQTLTRDVPAAQDANLFTWLGALYPIWAGLRRGDRRQHPDRDRRADALRLHHHQRPHLYLAQRRAHRRPDRAALEIGIRFHAARGSMSVGKSQGGLPPDRVVEDETAILRDSRRAIETYHDAGRYAMVRIVLAPCSPFSVSPR